MKNRNWTTFSVTGQITNNIGFCGLHMVFIIYSLFCSYFQLFKKLNMQPLYHSTTVLLDIYHREMKTYSYKNLYMNVHSSFICNNQKLESAQMFFNRLNKLWYIHTIAYYAAIKKNKLLHALTWISLQEILQSKRGQYLKVYTV